MNKVDYDKNWRLENKERISRYRKEYYQKNRAKEIQYQAVHSKERYYSDINYKLAALLRTRLYRAVERNSKAGSAVRDLGCSIQEFKQHLESKFKEGMDWKNYGEWQIDHIKPLSKFDLSNKEQFLEACHYTNLQPLWHMENLVKGNR